MRSMESSVLPIIPERTANSVTERCPSLWICIISSMRLPALEDSMV